MIITREKQTKEEGKKDKRDWESINYVLLLSSLWTSKGNAKVKLFTLWDVEKWDRKIKFDLDENDFHFNEFILQSFDRALKLFLKYKKKLSF